MATLLNWSGVDVFTALTILHQLGYGSAQSSFNNTISPSTTTAPLPTATSLSRPILTSSSSMLVESPSSSPPPALTTTEDPIQRHLALIIGVPTGVGLSIIGLGLCMLWLACSSYCEYRKSLPQQPNTAGGATRSTNAPANTNSNSKSGSMPMKPTAAVSTSASESQAFQPIPDPEPESDPAQELDSDPAPDEDADTEQIRGDAEPEGSSGLEGSETANSQPIT